MTFHDIRVKMAIFEVHLQVQKSTGACSSRRGRRSPCPFPGSRMLREAPHCRSLDAQARCPTNYTAGLVRGFSPFQPLYNFQ